MTHKTLVLALVIAVMGAFLFSGVLHAILPHEHAHGQDAMWNDFHSALRHEDKKIFTTMINVFVVALLPLIISIERFKSREPIYQGQVFALLRRGVYKYRRFR